MVESPEAKTVSRASLGLSQIKIEDARNADAGLGDAGYLMYGFAIEQATGRATASETKVGAFVARLRA
jgi:hypothetical protein